MKASANGLQRRANRGGEIAPIKQKAGGWGPRLKPAKGATVFQGGDSS